MDIYLIILRLIHIFAGVFWVGSGALLIFFVSPTVKTLGPDGGKFMQRLIRMPGYGFYFPAVSLLAVISGALLFWETSDHFNSDWMGQTRSIVLSIGALAGILAFGHGGATLGRATNKMVAIANQIDAQGGPPTDEQMKTVQETSAFIDLHSRISFGLMVVAVAGMASWRYF